MPHYDITDVSQGSNYSLVFQAQDNNLNPINLSGYNISSLIKEKYSSPTGIASFSSVISVAQSGICTVSLSAAQTSGLLTNTYIYNVQVYNNDYSSVFSLLDGYLNVNPMVF